MSLYGTPLYGKKTPLWFSKIGRKWSAIKSYFEYHGWYFPKWSARTIVLPFFHILSFRFIIKQVKCYQSLQKLKNWKKISVHFWVCITGKVVPECWGASLASSSNSKPRAQTYPSNYLHDFISLLNCLTHVCSGFFLLRNRSQGWF